MGNGEFKMSCSIDGAGCKRGARCGSLRVGLLKVSVAGGTIGLGIVVQVCGETGEVCGRNAKVAGTFNR